MGLNDGSADAKPHASIVNLGGKKCIEDLVRQLRGNPKSCVGDWQRTLRRLDKLADVLIQAHRFRHTFATELLSKGVPVSEVAAILGNSPRIVEKHYSQWIHSRQQALDAAVKATWA